MTYIKLADSVWSYGLTSTELMVYIAIKKHTNVFDRCIVKHSTLARLIDASCASVSRATHGLQAKGLLFIHQCKNKAGEQIANGYTLETMHGGYTVLPAEILSYKLPKSVFKVYAYLLKCKNSTSLQAVPSLSQMVAALNMSKQTIVSAVKYLHEQLLICKTGYARKSDKRIGHNRHFIIDAKLRLLVLLLADKWQKKQKEIRVASSQKVTRKANSLTVNCIFIILQVIKKCKGLICKLFSHFLI
ncbi:MAG: hypothetical protein RSF33_07990 [Hydrogenoanaerobacterium sp.]